MSALVSLLVATSHIYHTVLIGDLATLQAAHFFWGLWGLIQARFSEIDFDYLE